MKSSVQKKVFRAFAIASLTANCVFAQSPVGAVVDATTINAPATLSAQTNDLFVNQWIHLDNSSSIKGSVVALVGQDSISLSKITVSLSQNGTVVASDDTDVDGDFLIEKLSPGLYSLTAEGAGTFATFSLAVLDANAGKQLPNAVEVRVLPSSSRVAEIIRGQTLPKASMSFAPTKDPLESNRKVAASHQILLDAQGVLSGRLGKAAGSVDMSSMTVFVMKDGVEVKRVRVASNGSFSIPGLTPSCYGLVAAGDQGVAAVGFCAVNRSVVNLNRDQKVFVATSNALPSSLNIEVTDPPAVDPTANPDLVTPDAPVLATAAPVGFAPAGMSQGYSAGGSYGGGSGGGGTGGGGFGALAAIGGLAAVGIIAATDNNEAAVVSPVVP